MTRPLAVAEQGLAVPQHGVGGVNAHQPLSGLRVAEALDRVPPDEVDRLPARDREPEAGRERIDERPDVVPPGTEPALDTRRVEGERTGVAESEVGPGPDHVVVEVGREPRRHRQLPAQLPGERDPERPGARPRDVDLAGLQERPRLGRDVGVGQSSQQLAGTRSGQVERRPPEVTSVTTAPAGRPRRRSASVRRWVSVGARTRNDPPRGE